MSCLNGKHLPLFARGVGYQLSRWM